MGSKESNNNEGIKPNNTEQSQNVQTIKEHAKSDSNISTNKESASLSQLQDIVYGYNKGDSFLNKYKKDNKVNQIILVEQSDSVISMGVLYLLIKNKENEWQESLRCKAFLGKNGIDKVREGDKRTPTGDYGFLMAFGAQNNPDSIIPYGPSGEILGFLRTNAWEWSWLWTCYIGHQYLFWYLCFYLSVGLPVLLGDMCQADFQQ